MKKILFLSVLVSVSSLMSCRNQPNEVGFSCSRLTSCYSSYSSLVKEPQIKFIVENAQKAGDETGCINAINQLTQSIGQQCPF